MGRERKCKPGLRPGRSKGDAAAASRSRRGLRNMQKRRETREELLLDCLISPQLSLSLPLFLSSLKQKDKMTPLPFLCQLCRRRRQ